MVPFGMPMAKSCRGNYAEQVTLLALSVTTQAKRWSAAILLLLLWVFCARLYASESVHVAAASNFSSTLKILKLDFEASNEIRVIISTASTGKIYAQILNGAPFDVFLAADQQRPELLVEAGLAYGSFTYAIGQLVAWHPHLQHGSFKGTMLSLEHITHIAIANPKIAPYGQAAQQWLESHQQWTALVKGKIVRGENVAQALQFVEAGHAQIGLVAYSDVIALGRTDYSLLDPSGYAAITQQAVQLNSAQHTLEFVDYLRSSRAKQIIAQHGYRLP